MGAGPRGGYGYNPTRREGEGRCLCCPNGLSSYLCRLCAIYPIDRGDIHTTTIYRLAHGLSRTNLFVFSALFCVVASRTAVDAGPHNRVWVILQRFVGTSCYR